MNEPSLPRSEAELDALFARARTHRADTSAAEFAFETRLLARLRADRVTQVETGSVWALVSWRLIPFFAACVVALTVWHSQIVTETNEAEQKAYVENAETMDSWNSLN
jgi:hypothetical protein